MGYRVRRRSVLLTAVAGAAAPLLAAAWITPGQAASAEEESVPAAAGTDAAKAGAGGVEFWVVQHGKAWRLPVQHGHAVDPKRSGVAVVKSGTRDRLEVQLRLAQKDLVLPTRGFASGWTFTPGDLVAVKSVPTSRAYPAGAVAEPLTRVVAGDTHTEVWAPNMTGGPRLAALAGQP
ncbi:MAG TPA: hypothetical protein VJT31_42365 [Rugosimonospora sp.]|nr:hypothetical protein [Rugosimonospora sp.]